MLVRASTNGKSPHWLSYAQRSYAVMYRKFSAGYLAIGIFRNPSEHGPLTDMANPEEDRDQLHRVLANGSFFTDTDPEDFGYSSSDFGKLKKTCKNERHLNHSETGSSLGGNSKSL